MVAQNLLLQIEGRDSIETKSIDSIGYLGSHKNVLSIKTEIETLRKRLNTIGFIENKLNEFKKKTDSVFFVKLHLKPKFNSLYIYYGNTNFDKTLIESISKEISKDYFRIDIAETENVLSILNSNIANQGFPFSKLKLSNIEKTNQNDLNANLILVNDDEKRTINDIKIIGYTQFPKSFLKHFLKLKTTQVLNLEKIKNKTQQLSNLRFATEVKAPEILFQTDSTALYIYIEKSKSNTFDGFLGFGTNDDTNRLEFDGFLNLRLINNLNFGETFSLLYKSDEIDQDTFDAKLELPYLFNTPLGINLNLKIFRKDSLFTTIDQKAGLHYQINPLHKITVGVSNITSNNLSSNSTSATLQDYNSNYVSSSYLFLKQQLNNALFPIKSQFITEVNYGNRTSSNIKTEQTLINSKVFNNFKLNKRNSFYINFDFSTLISNTYFDNELLRFGGINSIRGFEENSIFATLFGVTNTEYRYKVSNAIYVHTITDFSYFENKLSNVREKLFSFGFGFGILTNSGLLKFNYANGKNENQTFKLSNSKIHISLVANF